MEGKKEIYTGDIRANGHEVTQDSFRKKIRYHSLRFFSAGRYVPGISNAAEMDMVAKYVIFNIFVLAGLLIFLPFTVNIALTPGTSVTVIVIDIFFCLFLFLLFVFGRTKMNFYIPASLLVFAYLIFVCFMLISHPIGGPGAALWSYILPPLAFYVLGNFGIIPSVISALAMIYAFDADPVFYSYDFALRCATIFVFTVAFASLSFKRTEALTLSLMRNRALLQRELHEIEIMKDNLQAGVFLLDAGNRIQPLYSQALTNILEKENLDNVDFLSVLHDSLKEKEINLLKDYLEMLFLGVHDEEILQDVNPLQKFTFLTESKQEKVLTVSFSQIKRVDGEKVLLVVMRDITYESVLEEKLAKEEQFRQQEMKAMFEVMHVSPQNLDEFLDELDFEFSRMNDVLKDKERPQHEVFVELFQGIHAMKSNALVIGLESPAERFHEFENKLALLIEDTTANYEDLLEIVFELERVMGIVDNLRDVLKKMEAFSDKTQKVQSSSEILLQAIRNTINKAKAETGKKAIVKANKLDWDAISPEYRRVLKEIIMQFTRNAVVHGLEDSASRIKQGKKEEGIITLSIEKTNDKIDIVFSDDGAGIDFEKIKKQAVEKNLLSGSDKADNKAALIKALFMPGFSTADGVSLHAGRGVGLSLVSDRIKEYKGKIKVQSSYGKGTKFIVEIPCA